MSLGVCRKGRKETASYIAIPQPVSFQDMHRQNLFTFWWAQLYIGSYMYFDIRHHLFYLSKPIHGFNYVSRPGLMLFCHCKNGQFVRIPCSSTSLAVISRQCPRMSFIYVGNNGWPKADKASLSMTNFINFNDSNAGQSFSIRYSLC